MADYKKAGKDKLQQSHKPLAPNPAQVLEQLLIKQKELPFCIPQRPIDAAQWWFKMQKPQGYDEKPQYTQIQCGEGYSWKTPYIDRLTHNLRMFLRFTTPQQKYIVAAREDDVWWNGDQVKFFEDLVEETALMKDMGVIAYRKHCCKKARELIMGNRISDKQTGNVDYEAKDKQRKKLLDQAEELLSGSGE